VIGRLPGPNRRIWPGTPLRSVTRRHRYGSSGITPINLYGTAYLPLTAARDHSESPPTTGHKTAFMQVIAVIRSQS
jgi:hypothetical protein